MSKLFFYIESKLFKNEKHVWFYALLSALFAALTAILAKVGIKGINSDLATAIRTIFILVIAWGIVLAAKSFTEKCSVQKQLAISWFVGRCHWFIVDILF
jgi:uncharacterized membrane protein